MAFLIVLALTASLCAGDPVNLNPFKRLKPPSSEMWFGADHLGRDVFARTIFGARVSLLVGLVSATFVSLVGLLIGLIAGYSRSVDNVVMRIMDGLMSIPTILLAIALISDRPRVGIVIVAITITHTRAPRGWFVLSFWVFGSVLTWRRRSAAARACPGYCGGTSFRAPFLALWSRVLLSAQVRF